ncbi:hypothetical protein [Actinoallomurus sp. NPDC050550]|uniref:hypothetical protein n=1 Tax=Actinoallomurus sp. NPDC050550 TaxID=3154937 RepID=UPI0033DEAB5B
MIRKIALAAAAGTVATGVIVAAVATETGATPTAKPHTVTAGHTTTLGENKAKPRHTLRLAAKHAAVHSGRFDTFTVGASTTAGQATGLKVCLERALPKGPGWETLKCVTTPAEHGKGTATYQISQKLAHKGAGYQFRAVAYNHGKAWAAPSNTVFVSVK